ncbi:hypothetical protein CAP35_10095 [Chitinophagaceae bacterium IBVUCB1]|nr:hypothetical protein CAP35_10095 [Chitinophagaceae bacterium IBVUCB1]
MNCSKIVNTILALGTCIIFLVFSSCDSTKHVPKDKYLLRSNEIKLKATVPLTQKGELKENLSSLVVQKTNTYSLIGNMPIKLYRYNLRYDKYEKDPKNFQLKTKSVEPPVLYDSTLKKKSAQNIRTYLFNKGFFYAKVTDTTIYKKKKAYVTYNVETGTNYLINKIMMDVDDSAALSIINAHQKLSTLKSGADFQYDALEAEKSRIATLLRNNGFYKFTQDNISFELDTFNKQYFKDAENPFESAVNFISLQKNNKKPTLDIRVIIRSEDEKREAYRRYGIRKIIVYPDFQNAKDLTDTNKLINTEFDGVQFKYHHYYVREKVIKNHLVVFEGAYYSQQDYDETINKMNELGIFQTVRITYTEDTVNAAYNGYWLHCYITMTPADKYDYNTSLELSNGTTYLAGTNLTLSLRNKNVAKGANLLTLSLTGGLESFFDTTRNRLDLLSRSGGFNTSIDFPKFLFPIKQSRLSSINAPRTVTSAGIGLVERIDYFTMINISASLTYKWRETKTKFWEVSPAFINRILPTIYPQFEALLKNNEYLQNTYKPTFIQGENVTFTFSDKEKKKGINYNFIKVSGEEAGILMKGLNGVFPSLMSSYAQYLKFDLDGQKFFNRRHSTLAFRLQAGVGIPYDNAKTLPYIKQYFVGGAYSLRGFRIRTLGPGSYKDTAGTLLAGNIIDRTGDMKMEFTTEYRFDVVKLFAGAIKLNGALFADAGNIWLTRPSNSYPGGEFAFNKFGNDLAIDAGLGIRLDAGFLVARFDFATPVKKPMYADGTGNWMLNDFSNLWNQIRRNDWVINFAIGYPF